MADRRLGKRRKNPFQAGGKIPLPRNGLEISLGHKLFIGKLRRAAAYFQALRKLARGRKLPGGTDAACTDFFLNIMINLLV